MTTRLILLVSFAFLILGGCVRRQGVERVEWSVMGTVAAMQAKRTSEDHGQLSIEDVIRRMSTDARGIFTSVETLLNAHNHESEISRIAQLPDAQVVKSCTKEMLPCYKMAFEMKKATGGAFNPRWRGENTIDLGAIAKGFAVDLAAERMDVPKGVAALVDLGGNIKAVRGKWRTGVRDPGGNGFAATVDLTEGEALATSATYFRGEHIYDGRTCKPVDNGVASVTVLCDSAMMADGLSTTLFVLGPDDGRAFLERHLVDFMGKRKVEVLWILSDGSRIVYGPDNRFQ